MRTSSLRTLPPPDVSPSSTAIVTLAQVRCGPRAINEYVDSPRTLPIAPLKSTPIGLSSSLPPSPAPLHSVTLPCRASARSSTAGGGGGGILAGSGSHGGSVIVSGGVGSVNGGGGGGGSAVISTQPTKSLPLKDDGGGGGGGGEGERGATGGGDGHSSIICSKCGKCRCAACSEPRELPAKWCCGNRYEVNARLDVCTCFCCVQAVFYHCGAEEDNACYDKPCACGGSKCCARWACITGAAMLLPCLWCYWPMRGCLAATTACYNCCRKKGCQCSKRPGCDSKPNSQTRRLLVESDSSSA